LECRGREKGGGGEGGEGKIIERRLNQFDLPGGKKRARAAKGKKRKKKKKRDKISKAKRG